MRNEVKPVRKDRFGELEIRLLSYAQLRQQSVMRLGEFREALDLTATQEKVALSRLARADTIVRLKREVYLMPSNLPLGGVWNPGPYLILRSFRLELGSHRSVAGQTPQKPPFRLPLRTHLRGHFSEIVSGQ